MMVSFLYYILGHVLCFYFSIKIYNKKDKVIKYYHHKSFPKIIKPKLSKDKLLWEMHNNWLKHYEYLLAPLKLFWFLYFVFGLVYFGQKLGIGI